jgi:hypothetical protein
VRQNALNQKTRRSRDLRARAHMLAVERVAKADKVRGIYA